SHRMDRSGRGRRSQGPRTTHPDPRQAPAAGATQADPRPRLASVRAAGGARDGDAAPRATAEVHAGAHADLLRRAEPAREAVPTGPEGRRSDGSFLGPGGIPFPPDPMQTTAVRARVPLTHRAEGDADVGEAAGRRAGRA